MVIRYYHFVHSELYPHWVAVPGSPAKLDPLSNTQNVYSTKKISRFLTFGGTSELKYY